MAHKMLMANIALVTVLVRRILRRRRMKFETCYAELAGLREQLECLSTTDRTSIEDHRAVGKEPPEGANSTDVTSVFVDLGEQLRAMWLPSECYRLFRMREAQICRHGVGIRDLYLGNFEAPLRLNVNIPEWHITQPFFQERGGPAENF